MSPDLNAAFRRSAEDVATTLGADVHRGLTDDDARARLARDGLNELASETPVPAWRQFLAQFQDVLVILLLIATAVSAAVWFYERDSALPYEAIAIFAVVLLNAAMGYVQEARAEAAVAALRAMSAAEATSFATANGNASPRRELVPGDIILIEEGDTIPADARVVESTALQTAEAALTGESLPVAKDADPIADEVALGDRSNMIFSGTAATYRARQRGRHRDRHADRDGTHRRHAARRRRPRPRRCRRSSTASAKLLGVIVVAIAVVMIVTIVLVEDVRGFRAIFDVLILGVALAVAAVPEGLARGRHRRAVARRAAHGETQRDRAPSRRGRDARLRRA